ncbi:MAG TPA: copper-binding protein, partial [Xanthomonadales bacterium]|nr:copper-binding protein [Xanthomonadales bacterium]
MTGIESGPWLEIIAGLQSGDEVVTSAQFLIDSEASLSGSLRRLDSSEKLAGNRPRAVFGSGTVTQMDIPSRRMTIHHGPIDALGWPSMTMEFTALPGVDMSRIQQGQSVHFSIRPDAAGVYVVDMVHLVDQDGEPPEPDHD